MQTNGPVQRRRLGVTVVLMPSHLVAQQNIVLCGKKFGGVVLKKRRVHAMGPCKKASTTLELTTRTLSARGTFGWG